MNVDDAVYEAIRKWEKKTGWRADFAVVQGFQIVVNEQYAEMLARLERAEHEIEAANDAYRGVMQWAEPLNQRCNNAEELADELALELVRCHNDPDVEEVHPVIRKWKDAKRPNQTEA